MSVPTLSVLIVTHNTCELLDGCLRSLRRSLPPGAEVIVIDNASTDNTVEHVQREFPEVRLDVCKSNLGFGAGMNRGIALAHGSHLFLLNSDTLLPRGTVETLLTVLESRPHAAVVGAQLTHANGRPQPSIFGFPTLPREFWNILPEIKYLLGVNLISRLFSKTLRGSASESREESRSAVESVSGAAFVARADAIAAIGGFDDGFFLYHEERDLCRRLWKSGWEVWFAAAAHVIHHDAQSTGYRRSRLPKSPVLEYRLLSMDRLWHKHKSATMHQLWRLQTRGLLMLRCIAIAPMLPFRREFGLQRIKHLWKTQRLLKGKSILGRDLEGGWATKTT